MFPRYLSSKRTVDDRALNRQVWDTLVAHLPPSPRILEIGAGTGTMFQRMVDWGALTHGVYTAIDAQPENIRSGRENISAWAQSRGLAVHADGECLSFTGEEIDLSLRLNAMDLYDFLRGAPPGECWDVLVANAFLDLVDVPVTLPRLCHLLQPGGLLYLTINFDGLTILEPPVDPRLDEKIMDLYHRSMDERIIAGLRSGDSRTGRHMFSWLRAAGLEILSAGSSDWAVFAGPDGKYPADEAFFLEFILGFFAESLSGRPELADEPFADWLAARRSQIQRGELVYIAHQMDFLARLPAGA
jgi:SAM-dependent methyltransferase